MQTMSMSLRTDDLQQKKTQTYTNRGISDPRYDLSDIDLAAPRSLVQKLNQKPRDPLNPDYQLPAYTTRPVTPPKFVRDSLDVSDIERVRPHTKYEDIPTRSSMLLRDIPDTAPKPRVMTRVNGPANDSLSVKDIMHVETKQFESNRRTNPLNPTYIYGQQTSLSLSSLLTRTALAKREAEAAALRIKSTAAAEEKVAERSLVTPPFATVAPGGDARRTREIQIVNPEHHHDMIIGPISGSAPKPLPRGRPDATVHNLRTTDINTPLSQRHAALTQNLKSRANQKKELATNILSGTADIASLNRSLTNTANGNPNYSTDINDVVATSGSAAAMLVVDINGEKKTNDTADITGAQAGTRKTIMRTQRETNPVWPEYNMLAEPDVGLLHWERHVPGWNGKGGVSEIEKQQRLKSFRALMHQLEGSEYPLTKMDEMGGGGREAARGKGKPPRGSTKLITNAVTSTATIPGESNGDRSGNGNGNDDGIGSRGFSDSSLSSTRAFGGSLRSPTVAEQQVRLSSIVQASPTRALHPKRIAQSGTRQLQQQTQQQSFAASAAASATINGTSDNTLSVASPSSRPRSRSAATPLPDNSASTNERNERALALPSTSSSSNVSSDPLSSTSVRPVSRLSATMGATSGAHASERATRATRSVIGAGTDDQYASTASTSITYNEPLQLTHQRASTTSLVPVVASAPSSTSMMLAEPASLASIAAPSFSSIVTSESVEDVVAARYAARKAAAAAASGRSYAPYVPPRVRAPQAPILVETPAAASGDEYARSSPMSFSRSLPVALSPHIDALLRPTLASPLSRSPNGKKEAEIAPAFVPKRRPYSARASPRRSESPVGGSSRRMMASASTTHMMRSISPAVGTPYGGNSGMHTPTTHGGMNGNVNVNAGNGHSSTWFGNSVPTDRETPIQKGPLLSHEQSSLLGGHTLAPSSSIRGGGGGGGGRSSSRTSMLPSAATSIASMSSTAVLPPGTPASLNHLQRAHSPSPYASSSKRVARDQQKDVDAVRALR